MITSLRIRNFKRYLDQAFPLAQLTVLTGLNSSGKSTVLQSILLAHQAQISSSRWVYLNAEPGLALGQPTDVLALNAESTQVTIDLVADGEPLIWNFETHFDGSDSASHILCRSRPNFELSISYLSAERLGPRMSHSVSPKAKARADEPVDLGDDGRFLAHALAEQGRREVTPMLLHPSQPKVTTLQSQTEAWVSELLGSVQLEARLIPRTDLATLHVRSSGTDDWLLPTNVGFGVSYALPIVVAGLMARPGSILIVDSPEAHLHPAAQSGLAGFLALVSASGVQVIVETHSDHVLNGLRKAVVRKAFSSRDLIIHFLSGQLDPEVIQVDERGRPSSWPSGFFDQLELDLRQITRPNGSAAR